MLRLQRATARMPWPPFMTGYDHSLQMISGGILRRNRRGPNSPQQIRSFFRIFGRLRQQCQIADAPGAGGVRASSRFECQKKERRVLNRLETAALLLFRFFLFQAVDAFFRLFHKRTFGVLGDDFFVEDTRFIFESQRLKRQAHFQERAVLLV